MILPDLLTSEARASRFARICDGAMAELRAQGGDGIGTLAEKWQHQIIKRYLSENPNEHEVKLEGTRFVTDVRVGNEAFEVQTAAFGSMAKKIAYYLEHTDLTVTVVHPIAKKIQVSRIDADTAEILPPKRSPKHGKDLDLLAELYPLIPYLNHPRLRFRILLLEVWDFKLLPKDGRRRRGESRRFERIPTALIEDRTLSTPADFRAMLPPLPSEPFTVKQFSLLTKLRSRDAYSAVRVLKALGILTPAAPIGRSMAFERKDLGGETPS